MPDYRFARTPIWIVGHVLVVFLLVLMVNLGFWQLRRLDERRATNALVVARATLLPEPVDELVDAGEDAAAADAIRFRAVEGRGTYDPDATVVVRANQDGAPGGRVFTVLDLGGGAAVAVLRGFEHSGPGGALEPPAPPAGEVEVTGIAVPRHRLELVSRQALDDLESGGAALLPVVLQASAADDAALTPVPPPDLGEGPHLSYAVQWFLFSTVGAVGYPFLLRRRARHAP